HSSQAPTTQYGSTVEEYQRNGHTRCDEISYIKIQLFTECEQQYVKQNQSDSNQNILNGVNKDFVQNFHEEENQVREYNKQNSVLRYAHRFLVNIYRNLHVHPKHNAFWSVLITDPLLWKVSIQV